ncbi:MAG: type II toxin-antitoxin system VapC family toxin [Planctomycetes bacterium]|nr:type II toxin-antitoxin system VapC family toxin [Planctomycetota bacterium]
MRYLLDTNTCIAHLKSPPQSRVTRRLAEIEPGGAVLCSVVKAELIYGALRSREVDRNRRQLDRFFGSLVSLPFDDRAAEAYGRIRSELAAMGTPIGPNDLMIAAIARANDLTLVTHNTSEFGRVPGLGIEDWEA